MTEQHHQEDERLHTVTFGPTYSTIILCICGHQTNGEAASRSAAEAMADVAFANHLRAAA